MTNSNYYTQNAIRYKATSYTGFTANNVTTGTITQAKILRNSFHSVTPLADPKPKEKPKFTDKVRDAFVKLAHGGPMKDPDAKAIAKLEAMGMPLIAGAAPEAEVKKTVEVVEPKSGKKKITLERTVPMRREKQGKMQDIHRGKVHLVRTTDGPEHLTRSVGIKVEPLDNSGHVEIPIKDLREALDELEA